MLFPTIVELKNQPFQSFLYLSKEFWSYQFWWSYFLFYVGFRTTKASTGQGQRIFWVNQSYMGMMTKALWHLLTMMQSNNVICRCWSWELLKISHSRASCICQKKFEVTGFDGSISCFMVGTKKASKGQGGRIFWVINNIWAWWLKHCDIF